MDERRECCFASCLLAVAAMLLAAGVVLVWLGIDGVGHQLVTALLFFALGAGALGCHCLDRRDAARIKDQYGSL